MVPHGAWLGRQMAPAGAAPGQLGVESSSVGPWTAAAAVSREAKGSGKQRLWARGGFCGDGAAKGVFGQFLARRQRWL